MDQKTKEKETVKHVMVFIRKMLSEYPQTFFSLLMWNSRTVFNTSEVLWFYVTVRIIIPSVLYMQKPVFFLLNTKPKHFTVWKYYTAISLQAV